MLIITVETHAANVNFFLDGPLSGAAVSELARIWRARVESLLHSGVRRVRLDLSGVSDVDAAGVGELIHLFKMVAAAGGVLEVERLSPRVRHVLDVAGVLGLLTAGDVEYAGARSTCR
jgi:anti-anti-sigma factor